MQFKLLDPSTKYTITNGYEINISADAAKKATTSTITIDASTSWTIPKTVAYSDYGYLLIRLDTVVDEDYGSGTSTFGGYCGSTAKVYIPPTSTRKVTYPADGDDHYYYLYVDKKRFFTTFAQYVDKTSVYFLVPATANMVKPITLYNKTGSNVYGVEYVAKNPSYMPDGYYIDNNSYINSITKYSTSPGYVATKLGLTQTETSGGWSRRETITDDLKNGAFFYIMYPDNLSLAPVYEFTYQSPKIKTNSFTISDGHLNGYVDVTIDMSSVAANSSKCELTTIVNSDTTYSGSFAGTTTTSKVDNTTTRFRFSNTCPKSSVDTEILLSSDSDTKLIFKCYDTSGVDTSKSTVVTSVTITGAHPAFVVSNKCQSIGIFKHPDRDSNGNEKSGLTIGDAMYLHSNAHRAITVVGENTNVGAMIDVFNSDISGNQVSIGFGIGSGHVNRGIYDNTLNGWSVYTNSAKELHLGSANSGGVIVDQPLTVSGKSTLNGAVTATAITCSSLTSTGNVVINSDGAGIYVNNPFQTYDYKPNTTTYQTILAHQSNSKTTAYVEHERSTTGEDKISILASHWTNDSTRVLNKLSVGVDANGNCTYGVSSAANFRSAIGANNAANLTTGNLNYERIRSALEVNHKISSSTTPIKYFHGTAGWVSIEFYGSLVVVNVFQAEVSTTSTWETVTQLASGCRPAYTARAPLAAGGTASYNGGSVQVNTSGVVALYNPISASGSTYLCGCLVYVAAK